LTFHDMFFFHETWGCLPENMGSSWSFMGFFMWFNHDPVFVEGVFSFVQREIYH
jgi:hypothetical protein